MIKSRKRILLSGVFGPFGVDDEWGRKENIMELFHNQVTKAQGVASFRFHHRSFGLYFIAENVDADVTVLDFPSLRRFEKEVAKGYDIVGVSFIAPNFVKAREMARITRKRAPGSVIVLGGHGAAIEGVEDLIDCDHVARGEGIRWMRTFLGQNPDAPIVHPTLPSAERASIMGAPVPGTKTNLLVPGVGCVNGCSFCCTSHFFGKTYTPFLATGREMYETCARLADERGTDDFFVMDENFLKDRRRAEELLDEMDRHGRYFTFQIFSSAEAIRAFGVDNMVRLGVMFVWVGIESCSTKGNFAKNRGIDAHELVREMREKGIIVLASGILCQEHHTEENIQQDIDFMVSLDADFVQFMLLMPEPVTALYLSHKKRGLLREDLPYEEWHGQKHLSFIHPGFPGDSAERWIHAAFEKDYAVNSSSMYRVVETTHMGYRWLSEMSRDACLDTRKDQIEQRLRLWSCTLPSIVQHRVNATEARRARRLGAKVKRDLPPMAMQRLQGMLMPVVTSAWKIRTRLLGDTIQPRTIVTRYRTRRMPVTRPLLPVTEVKPERRTHIPVAAASRVASPR